MVNRHLIIFISLLTALILGIGLIWPKYQDLDSLQERVKEKKVELQYQEEYFSKLSDVSAELKEYSDSLSKIDSALPSDPSLSDLFNFLRKLSSQSGLILEKVNLDSISSPGTSKPKEIKINFVVTGSYSSFRDFLSILEKSARLIEVENISFSSERENLIPFNLKIKTYSY